MSLDVYLSKSGGGSKEPSSGIFIREDGQTKELTREEWDLRFPDREPVVVESQEESDEVYSRNITHNLGQMADAAGIYMHLWRPEEIGIKTACQLIKPLTDGLARLKADPDHFKQFNPSNGWGDYDGLVGFVEDYLAACEKYPEADVSTWR